MKIGELVENYIPKIFQYCEQSDINELQRLKDKSYSNKRFGIYKVNGELLRASSQWTIKHKQKFLIYLLDHNIITETEYRNLDTKVQGASTTANTTTNSKPLITITEVQNYNSKPKTYFDISLIEEATFMSIQYQKFYCLERSIRDLIRVNLESIYGNKWWDTLDDVVKRNVEMNLKYELDTTHTKRSEHKIDYTTFGDLRKIINSNWSIFESMFKRNLASVNEVMIDLNRLRVPIAHCTPLADKEIRRLEIRIDDWYQLLIMH